MTNQLTLFAPPPESGVNRRSAFGETLRVITRSHPQAAPGSLVKGHWNNYFKCWMTTAGAFTAEEVTECTQEEQQ